MKKSIRMTVKNKKDLDEWKKRKILVAKKEEQKRRVKENGHKIRRKIAEDKEKVEMKTEKKERRRIIMKGVEKKKGDQRWESEKKILKEIEAKIENMRKIYTDRQDKRYGLYWKKADKKLIWKRKRNLKGKKI